MESATSAMVLLLAVVISGLAWRLVKGIPLPLVQIAFGAVLAWTHGSSSQALDPEFFLFFFIPPLLFADARRYPRAEFKRLWRPITTLALGLVVFTVVGAGYFIDWLIPSIPLPVAFALAAVLSPTDPVAVSAITAATPVPRTMMHVLEGEALLNDATGLVGFRFAVAAAVTGTFSILSATSTFFVVAIGGLLIGAVIPFAISLVQRFFARQGGEDTGTQVLTTLLQPFAAYLAAEHLHCSGILAAVAAGLVLSFVEDHSSGSAEARLYGNAVWRMVQFALEGAIFVLLGEQIPGVWADRQQVIAESQLAGSWDLFYLVLAVACALIFLRFVYVAMSARLAGLRAARRGQRQVRAPLRMMVALAFAGVRGAITLAGVLTLPLALPGGAPFPSRDTAIFIAMGVILVSLVLAVVVLPFLLRDLEVSEVHEVDDDEGTRARLVDVALRRIEAAREDKTLAIDPDVFSEASGRIAMLYQRLQQAHSLELEAKEQEHARKLLSAERSLRLLGVRAEREELMRLRRARQLSEGAASRLIRELDLLETQLSAVEGH
ncbi:MAG: Na+/H+ antiporter [Polyangiales bacterium]